MIEVSTLFEFRKSTGTALFVTLAVLVGALALGCQPGSDKPEVSEGSRAAAPSTTNPLAKLDYSPVADTHRDEGGRVTVELSAAWGDDGLLVIRGVFTPEDAGYHLYGVNLPRNGVDGLGRPTLIEIEEVDLFEEIGPLVSDQKEKIHIEEALGLSMQVYPDGAVSLYLPLRFVELPSGPTNLNVKLTYMACSENRCHKPVQGASVAIDIPPPG